MKGIGRATPLRSMIFGSRTGSLARVPLVLLTAFALVLLLAGCGDKPAAVASIEGECKVFTGPETEVYSVTEAGQKWSDETVEKGVKVCGWKRPAPIPAAEGMKPNCVRFTGPDFQVFQHRPRAKEKTGARIDAGVIVCGGQPALAPVIDTTKPKKKWFGS